MLVDVLARNASLDNDYGPARGPNAADEHLVVLVDLDGAPLEVADSPGYVPVLVDSDSWPAAVDGSKQLEVTFAGPGGEWPVVGGWQLVDPATGAVWDNGLLADPLYVTDASPTGPVLVVSIAYQTEL